MRNVGEKRADHLAIVRRVLYDSFGRLYRFLAHIPIIESIAMSKKTTLRSHRTRQLSEADPWVSNEDLGRERKKAQELRRSQWWKRKVALGQCYYCGRSFPPEELTMDHVVPLVRGGKSNRANCVPCCKSCNTQKKTLLPIEWEEYLEALKEG